MYSAERATEVALDAIQCLGGNGYINDYDTGRILRDAKLYEIGAGTSEIRRLVIARSVEFQFNVFFLTILSNLELIFLGNLTRNFRTNNLIY